MTTKIIRGDGVTELSGVKTCVYTERVNAEKNLRPGCVAAASIEVEVYGSQANAVNAGEELTYYQVDANGNDTLIGVFYAEPSVPTKSTYKFTAYDSAAKLDCDFSERLFSISSSFPMTVKDIVDEACSVAGVTLGSSTWPLYDLTVKEFYSDGITCRQIVSWAAEIACCFVKCDTAGELVFDWYATKSGYSVRPGSGSNAGITYVPYKQDGLNYENYDCTNIQYIAIRPIETEGVAYIYPATVADVDATDANNDGNVALADITATDANNDGNVAVTSFINITDDNGNLTITNGSGVGNTLVIYDNLLLCDADSATMTAVATNIYNRMTSIGQYRPATISLFPFDNPFRVGDIVAVQDIQGVAFNTFVMEMRVSNTAAVLTSTGAREQDDVPVNTQSRMARLGENIVRIKNLVVDALDAVNARITNLFATNITATGSFQVNNGVYYLKQTTDGVELGSVDENADPVTPSARFTANKTDGLLLTTTTKDITLESKLHSILFKTSNLGITRVQGGLRVDRLINDNLDSAVFLERKTVTDSTSTIGAISLGIEAPNAVLYVKRTDATSICTPYFANGTNPPRWFARITDNQGNIVASTSVTLDVGYCDTSNSTPK